MKKRTKKKVDINRVYKAFALATAIGTMVKEVNAGDPKLANIFVQCSRAMSVFRKTVGEKTYHEVSEKAATVWGDVCDQIPVRPFPDEAATVSAILFQLMKESDMKTFLNFKIERDKNIRNEMKSMWISFAREFNKQLNEMFGVHDDFKRNKIGNIISPKVKPTPVIKEKIKNVKKVKNIQEKSSKNIKNLQKNKLAKQSKENAKGLREIIRLAKEKQKQEEVGIT